MRIVALEPHPHLRPYVLSYRIVEDIPGEFAGTPLWTCPEPVGVLSANFGNPSYHESGKIHPRTGLLGVQTHARKWLSQPETSFVMAMLTIPGMMALFPDIGEDSADHLLDVASIWGDRRAEKFWRCFPHRLQPDDVKNALDGWLLDLFSAVPVSAAKRYLQLHQVLTSYKRIDTACEQLGITPRMLQRKFRRHVGISPKQVLNLHRLQRSVRANAASIYRSSVQEFADQAHEIRTWRRYLGRTPGRYRTECRSAVAEAFAASTRQTGLDPTIFYL